MMRKLLYSFLLFIFSKFSSKKSFTPSLVLLCVGMFIVFSPSNAATYYSRQSGNWNSNATWALSSNGANAGSIPSSFDTVIIERGFTVTVNISNAQCASLQLGGSAATSSAGTLTFATTGSPALDVSGNIQLGSTGSTARIGTIIFVSGSTITASSVILGATGAGRGVLTMSANSLINTDSFLVNSTATQSTWTPSTGTVQLTASNTLPPTIFTTFNNLVISSGTTTFSSSKTISGTLTINSGAVANLSTLTHTAGALNLGGAGTSGDSWGSTTSAAANQNNTYFSATTGIVNVNSASCTMPTQQTITGGGTTCNSATGVAIGLSSSQTGVSYQLYRGTTALNTVTGTGAAISFGNFNVSGTYYVTATSTTFCSVRFTNSVNVTSYTTPAIPTASVTNVSCPTDTNGAITITSTAAPAALNFVRANNQVVDLGSALLSGRRTFTAEGWIKFDKANVVTRMAIFGQNDAIEIAFEDSNLRCWTPGGGSVDLPLTAYPSDSNWHHIAVTGDGTSGGLKIYLDGGTPRTGGSNTTNYGTSSNSTKIGYGVMDAAGVGFTGEIFKVGFWDRALSAAEVTALAGGFVEYNASQSGLLAGFNFSEGTGSTTISSVGSNALTGTFGSPASARPTWTDPSTYVWTSTAGFTSSSKSLAGLTPRTYNLEIALRNCSRNTSFTVNSINAATTITSQSTAAQTRCIGSPFNSISVSATGSSLTYQWYRNTSASITGAVTVTGNGANTNTYTPQSNTVSTYYYYCVVTGTCGSVTSGFSGAFVTDALHTLVVQGAGSANRSVCQNTAVTNVNMIFGGGATGAAVTGLPDGITSSISGTTVTISGTPTVSGVFNYSVSTIGGSCTAVTITGTITIGVGNNTISYTNGTSGTVCAFAEENNPIDFIAPAGNYFSTVTFASYGLPDGACGSYTIGSCHNNSSQSITEGFLLGKSNTVSFLANNTNYPDPCLNIVKRFRGSASYTQPICQGTTAPIISGSTPTGNGTYTYSWESSTTGLAGSFSPISGTNSKDYSPGILNQSTFFRRTVTSNGCSSTSTMVLVKVNPRPTSVVSGTTSICSGTSATVSVALTGTAPWSLTYSDGTNTTNVSGITASPYTFNVSPTANTTYTVTALNDANNCPSIPADRTGNAVISINPRPTAVVSGSTTICSGASTTISVAFTGTAPWNISYTYGATSGSFSTSLNPYTVSVNPTSTTTYSITALNDANCSALAAGITGDATITVNPLPTAPTVAKTDITCETSGGVSITNLPSGNWTINQTGTASQTILGSGSSHSIANLAAGTYNFTVTNASNCTSSPAVPATIVDQTSTTIWNGSSWSNGDPDSSKRVIVNSAANQPFTINIAACSLTINVPTGAGDPDVIIPNGVTLTITNSVTSNGKLVFESGSSLIQTTNAVNTGDIVYKRTTSVRRYDLTYWSMPVTKSGFTMHDLSPGTLYDKFHYYDSNAGKWFISNNGTMVMETGKGYTIRAPQSYDLTTPQDFTAVLTGVPNNGDISVPVVDTKWNLIGNPYPSAISAQQLMTDNPDLGSLYFWGHEELPVYNPVDKTSYYNNDYTIFNASGATTGGGGVPFNGYIAATQGFFAKPETGTIVFRNNERRAGNNSQFYKTAAAESIERNRVWLNITSSSGVFKQILFGYIQGATNSLDINYDAVSMAANSLVDFYSINTNKKLTIQGRALPFEKSDEVPLGYKLSAKGDYTISIDHADGIFTNQDVYLVDKETGKTTNLRLENYTFTTAEGSFNNRFVIRYTSKTLGTDDFENIENSVVVSVKDGVVKITSSKELLKEVNIFNVGAQLLYNKNKVNSSELIISNLHSSDQALLVKITLENGHTFTKKIIYSNL